MTNVVITKPISIFPATKQDGSPTRRLVVSVTPAELAEMPEELFAVKVSQSKNPTRAGKVVFKYFAYRLTESTPWTDIVPSNFNIATPVAEIKAAVVSAIGSKADAKVQFTINMPGKFANIETSDGRYSLYDFNASQDGNLGYYLKGGTVVTVTLTPSEHQGNTYYRVRLDANGQSPEDIFVRGGKGKVFGQDDAGAAETSVFSGDAGAAGEADVAIW